MDPQYRLQLESTFEALESGTSLRELHLSLVLTYSSGYPAVGNCRHESFRVRWSVLSRLS